MYHMTQSKQGISSIELGRRLGVRQTTAWMLKHKLQQAMMERDGRKRLKGRVEIDDAVLGGQRSGGKRGRGAPGKTPFVAAVETSEDGKPVRLKLRCGATNNLRIIACSACRLRSNQQQAGNTRHRDESNRPTISAYHARGVKCRRPAPYDRVRRALPANDGFSARNRD
jgi:hypothetical protein